MGFVNTVDSVGDVALTNSIVDKSIVEIKDNYAMILGNYAFYGCKFLTTAVFQNVTSVGSSAFYACSALKTVDFHAATSFAGSNDFWACSALEALIIRSGTVAELKGSTGFGGSGIYKKTGYIYVPAALVDSYKTATNWSTYANQIRAIEDYPEVCSDLGKVWTASDRTNISCFSVCHANDLWVAGSSSLYYSTDGKSWTSGKSSTGDINKVVCTEDGVWIAAASSKGIYYSVNGKSWSSSNVTSITARDVAHISGLYVAATASGLYYSTDGMTWTQSDTTANTSTVAYGGGVWVAGGNMDNGLYYSGDGQTWTQSNVTSVDVNAVLYAGNLWLACAKNGIHYSVDGQTWTQANITSSVKCVAYSNGVWVAGTNSSKGIYYSTDGKTWTQSNVTSYNIDALVCADFVWIAGGSTKGYNYYSYDGKNWERFSSPYKAFTSLCYANGVCVAGAKSSGGIYYSE